MPILRSADPLVGLGSADYPITWLFVVWGLDMVGPLLKVPGGFTHMFVAVEKLSKWIEARPLTMITLAQVVDFFLDILHQFGVPNTIITDNGTRFTGNKFTRFCDEYDIQVVWAAMAHPCTNGQVEHANGMILQGLKPRVFDRFVKRIHKLGGKSAAELPSVLWSLQTMPNCGMGFLQFCMDPRRSYQRISTMAPHESKPSTSKATTPI